MVNTDCASLFCVDGVCCDSACDSVCEACTAALKGGGVDGACEPVAAGTDPQDECAAEAPNTCGNVDGFCGGSSGCAKHPMGTLCGDSPSCAAGVQVNQDTCSGTGACVDKGTTPCGLYACGPSACKTSCAADVDCVSTAYCNVATSACVPKVANGTACAAANMCTSGFCIDGFCCNTSCGGACRACSNAKSGGPNGTCTLFGANLDPDNECATECNGAGACEAVNGTACAAGSICQSGFCVDGVCCNTACSATCQACTAAKNGGVSGTCGNVVTNTDPDSECTTECNGAGACEAVNGVACSAASQCQSGFCADGVCCNNACSGTCQACTNAKTGGVTGTCSNVTVNTDPDNECTAECNGTGACEAVGGTACTTNAQCQSGFCVDGVCCNSACTFSCTACSLAKTGVASGTCANVSAGTDPDVECPGTTNCNGNGQCSLLAQGAVCTLAAECASGFCADGRCCNSACSGLCLACSLAKTGAANGTCANVFPGTDPDNECSTVPNLNCAAGGVCGP
ncbi:MAG: hypothetical protein IPK82_27600 [Polyangiaceae bacterium]|nr:hypothetical protein [Polyangiaceae bacterium]